ncbi:MAG: histidine kinase [Flavobacteriales bacterium]|nr:histidine kinase [Flavobacteriales bacterium]
MRKILGLFLGCILVLHGAAQQYNFINYSIENGLAQSQVRAICQDNKGYLWIGTLGGLSKFDGVHFENFSINDGLLNNQINSIFNDSGGNLWFGTNGGVSYYDGHQFVNLQFKTELAENSVMAIAEDQAGNIWFATDGGGMVYYDGKELNYLVLPRGMDNNYIRHVVSDAQGKLWLATRNGITSIDKNLTISDELKDVNATQLLIDGPVIWCSTFGDGMLQLTGDSCIKLQVQDGLISNHIRAFVKRNDGSYWFAAKNGISKYMNGQFKNFTAKDGLKDPNIKCVIEDEEGNLFFGSDGGGLTKFTNEDFVCYTQDDVIGSNVVMSIMEDQNSNIWLSTYGDGVGVFTSKGYFLFTTRDGLGNNTVWCSMLSNKPSVWVGTSNGISEFDGKTFTTYDTDDGLNANKVYALQEDHTGRIWIGTKEGVSLLDPQTGSITNLDIARNIRAIYIDDNDYIWFCSSDGLVKYNVQTQNFRIYKKGDGLPDESVMNIVKDREGNYWIGTTNGLALLKGDQFYTITVPDNYASNNINFLQLDQYNSLWIGTNFGLYQLSVKGKSEFKSTDFIRYSNLDGLKSLECNQNSSFIDSKNNLWFGTSYGLVKHQLSEKKSKVATPRVQLKDVRLFFEKFNFSNYAKGKIPKSGLPNELVLPYNKNHLTFDFVGIYHTSPDKVKYRFKLEGFDEHWQPLTTSNFVTYSNIPSGDFTFHLSATTDMEHWSVPVKFSFTVRPPFWFTWWFFTLCVLVASGLVYLIVMRRRRIEDARRETQLIVDKSKMLSLEQQALNASMNRHFIFNALNSIQFYINRQDKISANKYLSSFAKLVRKNLDSSLENEIFLEDELDRINLYLKLEQMRFQDKFTYTVAVDPEIDPQAIKIPSMLLQPFIENSIWHGILPSNTKGHIQVDVKKDENKLVITVRDDGIGIDVSLAQKQGKKAHHDSKGMELTKGRINLISKISQKDCAIKGPYQIYDQNKKVAGTEVSIVISL